MVWGIDHQVIMTISKHLGGKLHRSTEEFEKHKVLDFVEISEGRCLALQYDPSATLSKQKYLVTFFYLGRVDNLWYGNTKRYKGLGWAKRTFRAWTRYLALYPKK
jgi:hypothetical protein